MGIDRIIIFNAVNGSVTQPSLVGLPPKLAEAHLALPDLETSSLAGNNLE